LAAARCAIGERDVKHATVICYFHPDERRTVAGTAWFLRAKRRKLPRRRQHHSDPPPDDAPVRSLLGFVLGVGTGVALVFILGERRCALPPPQITASLSCCLPSRSRSARAAPHAARSRARVVAPPSPRLARHRSARLASRRRVPEPHRLARRRPAPVGDPSSRRSCRREPVPPPATYRVDGVASAPQIASGEKRSGW
jgi:hypothetical protein